MHFREEKLVVSEKVPSEEQLKELQGYFLKEEVTEQEKQMIRYCFRNLKQKEELGKKDLVLYDLNANGE